MKSRVTAVVVTYNRLELLKKVIKSLENQTHSIDKIIVVDNGSTDGTKEWLGNLNYVNVIEQANTGSSGGQYTGIKAAYESGCDWIWTMDDDVIHDVTCLDYLMKVIDKTRIHAPLRYKDLNEPFYNDVKKFNLTFPFNGIWKGIFTKEDIQNEQIEAEGITFEGPIFHRSLVEKIGLPEKKFFIYGDDAEYFIRAKKAGFKILFEPAAIILRPFRYLLKWLITSKSLNDLKITFKAFRDGYFYKSEN